AQRACSSNKAERIRCMAQHGNTGGAHGRASRTIRRACDQCRWFGTCGMSASAMRKTKALCALVFALAVLALPLVRAHAAASDFPAGKGWWCKMGRCVRDQDICKNHFMPKDYKIKSEPLACEPKPSAFCFTFHYANDERDYFCGITESMCNRV